MLKHLRVDFHWYSILFVDVGIKLKLPHGGKLKQNSLGQVEIGKINAKFENANILPKSCADCKFHRLSTSAVLLNAVLAYSRSLILHFFMHEVAILTISYYHLNVLLIMPMFWGLFYFSIVRIFLYIKFKFHDI